MFDLTGQVAMVTGAARGLGQLYCRILAQHGADIIVSDLNLDTLGDTVKMVTDAGRKAFPVVCNVRSYESVNAAVDQAIEHFGKIDILVNNAGLNIRKRALDITPEDWNTVLEVNLRGQFFMAQAVGRYMKKAGYGRIINIGSATVTFAYKGIAPYCASRGGVKQMTASLACDFADYGISVNCLAPGWFATAQTQVLWENEGWREYIKDRIPQKRLGDYEELAAPLLLLAAKENSYMTGQVLLVDGGFTLGDTRATLESI